MHGQHINHGDIARRQGLGGLISGVLGGGNPAPTASASANSDPLGLGSIIGGVTSALLPPQSSESSSISQVSPTLTSASNSSSSSSSVSSSASTSSSSSSSTSSSSSSSVSSTSSTSTSTSSTPTSSSTTASAITSNPIATATQFVSPSSSSSDASATAPPKAFLQNKPLEGGVFAVVGIIALILIILVGTVWLRTASRRRLDREAMDAAAFNPSNVDSYRDEEHSSMEKLRRLESTSSGGHTNTTAGQAGYGSGYGGYPLPPVPNPHAPQFAQGYGQPLPYNGQRGYGNEYPAYVPPRSPNPVYDPSRTPVPPALPQLNIVSATPAHGSNLDDANPFTSPQNVAPQRRGSTSLLNSPPPSPSAVGEGEASITRQPSSHSKSLDPNMREMPVAPPLPARFGSDEDDMDESLAYAGHVEPRALKVANQ